MLSMSSSNLVVPTVTNTVFMSFAVFLPLWIIFIQKLIPALKVLPVTDVTATSASGLLNATLPPVARGGNN